MEEMEEKVIDEFLMREGKVRKPIVYTAGWRTEGIPRSDVCLLGVDPTEANYKVLCDAFNSLKGPEILYVPSIDSCVWIPDPRMSLEQKRQQKLPGLPQTTVSEVSVVDQGGHPNVLTMTDQHPRRDPKTGRSIFNTVYDEHGQLIEEQSYTPTQMKRARVPRQGFWLCYNYPEAYQQAFETPSKRKVIQEMTGYTEFEEASWLGMKNLRIFDWSLLKVSASGKVTELFQVEEIPFNRGRSCVLIAVGTGVSAVSPDTAGKWTVGARGGDTAVGNAIQAGIKLKIPGAQEVYREIKTIIENATKPGIQIAIETRIDQGVVKEIRGIIEYNYFDSTKMW
jgi:hypothetical protein